MLTSASFLAFASRAGRATTFFVTLLALAPRPSAAQSPAAAARDPGRTGDRAADSTLALVQARLDAYRAQAGFPGAVLAIAYPNGRVLAVASGLSDTARRLPMRTDHRLLMGSVGKTYVAAVALQLVREGRLDLDAPAARYVGGQGWFDSLPNAAAITVRHLMTHSSGLVRYEFRPEFTAALTRDPARAWDPRDQVRFLHGAAAPFAPGAGWEYSDTNYLVLALVLEAITGRPIDDEVAARLLRPHRLGETMPSDARTLPGLSQGYAGAQNPFGGRDAMLDADGTMIVNPQFEGAGGGYAATAADAARWGALFFSGRAFGDSLLPQALTGPAARLGPGTRYGLGMILRDSTAAGPMRGHSGFFPGYLAELRHYPERGLTVALLVNSSSVRATPPMARWVDELAAALDPRLPAPARGAAAPGALAITNVTVVPMTHEGALRDQTVVVRDGRIVALGPASRTPVPADAARVDGRGRWLIPGLADTHVHLFADGAFPDSIAAAELGVMVANGVTAARLMIGTPQHLSLRAQVMAGALEGPQLWVASPQFASTPQENGLAVATPEAARAAVRRVHRDGYDQVKLTTGITGAVYDAVVAEARSLALPVVGHVEPALGLAPALAAGQQLEHLDAYLEAALADSAPARAGVTQMGIFRLERWATLDHLDDRRLDSLAVATARAGVFVGPTLNVFKDAFALRPTDEAIRARPDWAFFPEAWRAPYLRARTNYWSPQAAAARTEARRARYVAARDRLVRGIVAAGGRVLAGSDTPEWFHLYGFGLHRELRALVDAGLTPYQALSAATRWPAEFLGAGGEWGTVAVGRRADLVLLRGDPLRDIAQTQAIDGVVLGGRWLPREALDARLARARREVGGAR